MASRKSSKAATGTKTNTNKAYHKSPKLNETQPKLVESQIDSCKGAKGQIQKMQNQNLVNGEACNVDSLLQTNYVQKCHEFTSRKASDFNALKSQEKAKFYGERSTKEMKCNSTNRTTEVKDSQMKCRNNLPPIKSSTESINVSSLSDETASHSEDGEDEMGQWDPMRDYYYSVNNINSKDIEFAVQGLTNFVGAVCPHANKAGGCYKGDRCPFEHHIDRSKIAVNPLLKEKLIKETKAVQHYNKLPEKPLAPGESVFIGTFSYVRGPQEFYVIPAHTVTCLCTEGFDKGISVVDPLTKMSNDLKKFYSNATFRNEVSYAYHELAAVRERVDNIYRYHRAVVTTTSVLLETDDVPFVSCFLIDVGLSKEVELSNLAKLPKFFCNDPPLAYKCSLYGVSPIYRRYPARVRARFLELVQDKEALIIIRRPYCPSEDGVAFIEPVPYSVELRVFPNIWENAKYPTLVDVKEELVKINQVLSWNPNPYRPHPWAGVTDCEMNMIVDKQADSGGFKGKISPRVMHWEKNCFDQMLAGIKDEIMKNSAQKSQSSSTSSGTTTTATTTPAPSTASFVTAIEGESD